jgi:hypothetical protein
MADDLNLGGLTKIVTALAAIAYATGVVAINTYLHELGIADFSFAKPKLLLTGILILFSLLLLSSHLFFLAWALASRHGPVERTLPRLSWVVVWALFFLLVLIGASALLCFRNDTGLGQITVRQARETIAAGSHLFRFRATLRVASEVYLPVLIAAIFVYVTTRIFDKARLRCDKLRASVEQFYLLIALASISVSVIGFVYMFTRTFYPAIPQEFGGGKPYYESLAIEESERCKMQQIGIPFEENQPEITKPLPVLHETDTLLAVWLRCPPKKDCNNGTVHAEDAHYVVVQIAKSSFSSTRAYATAAEPSVVPYQPPCNLNPGVSPSVNPGINSSSAPANP